MYLFHGKIVFPMSYFYQYDRNATSKPLELYTSASFNSDQTDRSSFISSLQIIRRPIQYYKTKSAMLTSVPTKNDESHFRLFFEYKLSGFSSDQARQKFIYFPPLYLLEDYLLTSVPIKYNKNTFISPNLYYLEDQYIC